MQDTEKKTLHQNSGQVESLNPKDGDNIPESFKQAEKDIKKGPDLAPNTDPSGDLDEGELARFEGEQ